MRKILFENVDVCLRECLCVCMYVCMGVCGCSCMYETENVGERESVCARERIWVSLYEGEDQ